jgi:hypothetical protein
MLSSRVTQCYLGSGRAGAGGWLTHTRADLKIPPVHLPCVHFQSSRAKMGVTRKRIQSALTMAMRLPLRRAFCSRTTHVLMRKGSQTQPFSSLARRVYVNRGPRRVPHKQIVSRIREPAVKKKPNLLQPPPAIPHRRVKIPQHRAVEIAEPTREQLHNYFVTSAVPMVSDKTPLSG